MGHLSVYVDHLNKRWLEGHITHETWRRHQNKLLEWHNLSRGRK
jgi:hypothetical protein